MFQYILFTLGVAAAVFMHRLDAHLVIKDAITHRYNRWTRLNDLVATTHTGKLQITWVSLQMIIRALYVSFVQYMNNTVRKLDRKTYEISYMINGKLYKMIVIPKRGPAPVLQISDDEQNDVTSQILPYMGPQYDWHGSKFKPSFFGHKSLTIELSNGEEYTCEEESHVE